MAQRNDQDRQKRREENVATVRKMVQQMQGELRAVLPKSIPVERFARICLTTIRRSWLLPDCSPQSVVGAMMIAAQDGLELDGVMAALVPYWNSDLGSYEAQYQPMYRGLMSLTRRTGAIVAMEAELVYKGDVFYYEKGLTPKLKHVPKYETDKNEDIQFAYSVATLKDGRRFAHVMPLSEVLKHRARSKSFQKAEEKKKYDSTWHTDFPPMALKTVIRDHIKFLPVPSDLQRTVEQDEARETGRLPATVPIGELMPAQEFDTMPVELRNQDMRQPVGAPSRPEQQDQGAPEGTRRADPAPAPAPAGPKKTPRPTKTAKSVFKDAVGWYREQHEDNPKLSATSLFRSVAEHSSLEEYTEAETLQVAERLEQLKAKAAEPAPAANPEAPADPGFTDEDASAPAEDKAAVAAPPTETAPAAAGPAKPGELFPETTEDQPADGGAAAEDLVPPDEMAPIEAVLRGWCNEIGVTTPKNQDGIIGDYWKEMGFPDAAHVTRVFVAKMKKASDTEVVFKTVAKVLLGDTARGKAKR